MRNRTLSALLASSSIVLIAAAASAQTARTPIAPGSTVSGTLTSLDAVHPERSTHYQEFTFEGRAGMVVEIIVASDELDTYAFLVGPDGMQLAYNDDGAGNLDSRIQMTLPSTGTYIIQATTFSQSSTGPFTVSLAEYVQLPIRTSSMAVGAQQGVQVTAQDGQCGEYGRRCQVLELQLDAAQHVSVEVTDMTNGLTVRALDPFHSTLWEAGNYYGEDNEQFILARVPGTYSLVLMGPPGATGTLSVQGAEAGSSASPAPITIGPGIINGELAVGDANSAYNSGVMDLYRVEADAGQSVQVNLNSNDFDAYLRVLDGANIIAYNDDTNGLNSQVRFRPNGNTVVEVSALGGSFGSYELVVELVTAAAGSPVPISVGETVQGSLGMNDNPQVGGAVQDAWVFEGVEGQEVSIVIQSDPGVAMKLISPMGEVLSETGDYGVYGDPMYHDEYDYYGGAGGGGSNGYSGVLPATGSYIINLSTWDISSSLSYTLSVRDGAPESSPIAIGSSVTDSLDQTDGWVQSVQRVGDIYTFSVQTPTALELGLSCNDSASVSLLDAAGVSVADISSSNQANARRSALLAPGNYSVVVSSGNPVGTPYTLSLRETTITPPTVQSLASGDVISGTLNGATFRAADGSAADYVEIADASGQVSIGLITSDYSVSFSVLDQTGEVVAYGSPTVSTTMDSRATPMTFDAVDGNRYIVVISSYDANGAQYRLERR